MNFLYKPVIVHVDFDVTNVLVDPKSFEVTGILDFETIKISDHAIDFLFYKEEEDSVRQLLNVYQHEIDGGFKNRI
ncbi:MAG: phosphotransferase [Candidatus Hodarchaeales archaeon]|jgi:aminoglycoside phosphotransferase (APT) family kinase protein